jgi:hypothetical protein
MDTQEAAEGEFAASSKNGRAPATKLSSLTTMSVDQLLDSLARVLADEAKRRASG